ncbi:MAG: MFS transporter [Bacteroidia bacterium]
MQNTPLDYLDQSEQPALVIQQKGHPPGMWLLTASKLFERGAYYGSRGLMTLYMVKHLQLRSGDTAIQYGFIIQLTYLLMIPGGILGDLLLGARMSMLIGNLLQAGGCFILATLPEETGFRTGIGMLLLGGALYGPNLLAVFARNYTDRLRMLDSGVYVLYLAINIGALTLPALASSLLGWNNFAPLFLIYGVYALFAMILGLFHPGKILTKAKEPYQSITGFRPHWPALFIALFLTLSFWAIYEAVHTVLLSWSYATSIGFGIINPMLVTAGSIIGAVLFGFFPMNSYRKSASGIVLLAICLQLLPVLLPAHWDFNSRDLLIGTASPIMLTCMLALAELLVAPMLILISIKYLPRNFLGTGIGVFFCLSLFTYNLAGQIEHLYEEKGIGFVAYAGAALLFLFVVGLLILGRKQKNDQP